MYALLSILECPVSTAKTAKIINKMSHFWSLSNLTLLNQIIDGVIVSSCFHSGYFLLQTLRPIANNALADPTSDAVNMFDIYVGDFCSNYIDVLPQRK